MQSNLLEATAVSLAEGVAAGVSCTAFVKIEVELLAKGNLTFALKRTL